MSGQRCAPGENWDTIFLRVGGEAGEQRVSFLRACGSFATATQNTKAVCSRDPDLILSDLRHPVMGCPKTDL